MNQNYFEDLLYLEYGTPSADTLLRVFALINPEKFMQIFSEWISAVVKQKTTNSSSSTMQVIPIDGKAIKSATDKINGGNIPYVVSAFLSDLGISIGQVKVDDKSNEITAIPELLDLIDISNCIITIDAIGCQKDILNKIVEKEGHYCVAVKSNQTTLYTEIDEYFKFALQNKIERKSLLSSKQYDKGHGRIERREAYLCSDVSFISNKNKWKNLAMIGMTRNLREINGNLSLQDKYYILDTKISSQEFLEITRKHWSIENNLHWILDVHFREDFSKAKQGHAIHNLSLLRKICYNLVKMDNSFGKISFKKKLILYNHDLNNLKSLIFQLIPSLD